MALDAFRRLRRVRRFPDGKHSVAVYLLERKVVAKHFDVRKASHVFCMQTEVKNLQRAQPSGFTPKLLAVDWRAGVLYLSYCGEIPKKITTRLRDDLRRKVRLLRDRYHLARPFTDGIPKRSNIALDHKGRANVIDLGPPFHKT